MSFDIIIGFGNEVLKDWFLRHWQSVIIFVFFAIVAFISWREKSFRTSSALPADVLIEKIEQLLRERGLEFSKRRFLKSTLLMIHKPHFTIRISGGSTTTFSMDITDASRTLVPLLRRAVPELPAVIETPKRADPKNSMLAGAATIFLVVVIYGTMMSVKPGIHSVTPPYEIWVDEWHEFNLSGAMIRGRPDAPVTMVVWTDYECPGCKIFHGSKVTVGRRNYAFTNNEAGLEPYVERGELRIVHKDYPLSSHPHALSAAIAARCAGEQDPAFFWAVRDKILSGGQAALAAVYANESGVDWEEFKHCVETNATLPRIKADIAEAQRLGITGVPRVYLNGHRVQWVYPRDGVKELLQEASQEE